MRKNLFKDIDLITTDSSSTYLSTTYSSTTDTSTTTAFSTTYTNTPATLTTYFVSLYDVVTINRNSRQIFNPNSEFVNVTKLVSIFILKI